MAEHGSAESTAGSSMERIVRNDAVFREANDRIRQSADEHTQDGDRIPFLCECADPNCHELIRMTLHEYGIVRSDATLFLNIAGHQASEHGHAVFVAQRDGHIVVEKVGPAGELAATLVGSDILLPGRNGR